MNNKFKSVKVGIISVLSILLLYFGMNFLKGINILNNGRMTGMMILRKVLIGLYEMI